MDSSSKPCLHNEFTAGRMLNKRYKTYSPLNHGSFGMVVLAKDCLSNNLVAIKCITKPSAAADDDSGFKVDDRSEELDLHTRIGRHRNVVNLLDNFETETHNYIVLEYCSMGDLYEAIRQGKGPKQTDHVRSFMLQLVDALEFIHSQGIYHRDIKPENIFLTGKGDMKLGDFGLATTDNWSYENAVGSDRYMAPEQYDHAGNGLSPAKADIWSLGICLLNILFSRNPFAVPASSDILYNDFLNDRQSLFDVFPNMSQDTFQVLVHCLAVDPAKRSLALVREALQGVVSFTIEDVTADDFCNEDREVVTATAGRMPLRTPSLTSPHMADDGAFPWTQALHITSPRKLSVIPDTETISEDLFAGSEASTHDWADKTDTHSFASNVDSGLGASVGSSHYAPSTRSKPMPIVASLPSRATSALASFFGKKKQFESKSWSDLWEEDEEEERLSLEEERLATKPPSKRPSILSRHSKLSNLSQEEESDGGRSTPRAILSEIKNPPSIKENPSTDSFAIDDDENINEHTGFVFEEDSDSTPIPGSPKYAPPTKRGLMDKWTALGDMRRRGSTTTQVTPKNEPQTPESLRTKLRPTALRTRFGRQPAEKQLDHSVWQGKEWNLSRDWRRSNQDLARSPLTMHPGSQLDGSPDADSPDDGFDSILFP